MQKIMMCQYQFASSGAYSWWQVSLFKKYSPVKHSIYGNRFLTGWKENSKGTPIIITNGLGTSRVDVRLLLQRVVLVVLHRVEKQKE